MGTRAAQQERVGDVVTWAHDTLDLTWEQVGELIGTSGRTVQRWRDREVEPSSEGRKRTAELDRLRFWLETVFHDDAGAADTWLHTRLLDLHGDTPREAILKGEIARITEFLATYHAGAFI